MPGRQAHGRPLLPVAPAPNRNRSSRSRSTAKALDAFGLASEAVPEKRKHLRTRDLDVEPARKRRRAQQTGDDDVEDGEGDSDLDDGSGQPPRKPLRRGGDEDEDGDSNFGSDSEGNEWQVGQDRGDDDSDIDSDEAFGEGDEERFEGFVFGGSSSQAGKKSQNGPVSGSDDDQVEDSFGEEGIDLADALDQASGSEDGSSDDSMSEYNEDEESSFGGLSDGDDEDHGLSTSRLQKLKSLASDFAGTSGTDARAPNGSAGGGRAKLSLSDLGLDKVKDRDMKKSLKLLAKEEKAAVKPGSGRRLEVPLARRQQDRLLRLAAAEKANATLDRWTETVKHNRRAEHLIFPLPQSQPGAGLDNSELAPLKEKVAGSELEQSIMAIMQESGLMPTKGQEKEPKDSLDEAPLDGISRAEVKKEWAQRRHERELHSREQARSKKIKKIKSKAWHRVHRKERTRLEMAGQEAAAANGDLDSDEEADAQDRRRAMERVGARHKESKWAKVGARTGRGVWDEGFKEGMKDMIKKDEELRRRVEGRTVRGDGGDGDGDEEEDSSSDESVGNGDAGTRRLLKQIESANGALDDAPASRLMGMAFMQRAEAALRRENDAEIAELKRGLKSSAGSGGEDDELTDDIGRRSYGLPKNSQLDNRLHREEVDDEQDFDSDEEHIPAMEQQAVSRAASAAEPAKKNRKNPEFSFPKPVLVPLPVPEPVVEAPLQAAGAWSRRPTADGPKSRKKSEGSKAVQLDLDLSAPILSAVAKPQDKSKPVALDADAAPSDDEAEAAAHHPLAIRDQELVSRAFADDEAVGVDFEREKAAVASDDEEKTIDKTLPGWGSWVGEGVSEREKQRHKGRFLAKIDAVKKKADRRDAKLDKVIISERRVRKNERYLASALPFPFENKHQYEQSLGMAVGPEWMTKESFQAATKPRVIVKQGIIAPMAKPMI